jgi:phosphate-selective porin OprO/OprP
VLTGEHRLYDRSTGIFDGVVPKANFSWSNGTWGAVELAAQLSTLDLDSGTLAGGRQRNVSLGLNWYLDPNTRMVFDYVHALVSARGYAPAVDEGRANIFQARLQLAF